VSSRSSRLKTEAASFRFELHRREAKVGQGAVHLVDAATIEDVAQSAIVRVDQPTRSAQGASVARASARPEHRDRGR
jgi:hypothetical protein